ncbi:hypothetical protein [Mesorhizobium caraganae]|uniref:hypothetical protein n=1 Tax=Mesorhizobium caraganae TaxID=483206 RepID=UPI00177AD312|nr:hypothetical protein [Mesorhizobium caraganae]
MAVAGTRHDAVKLRRFGCAQNGSRLERFTVFMETVNRSVSLFDAIPKGKRYALFPGKPLTLFLELL